MNKSRFRRLPRVIALAAVVLLGIFWFVTTRSNPHNFKYQGVRLEDWLEALWHDEPGAEQAIREIGTNAIPLLLELLHTRQSPPVDRVLEKIAIETDQLSPLPNLRPTVHHHGLAYCGFHALGPIAAPAIPSIAPLLSDDSQRSFYPALSLAAIGGVHELSMALTNQHGQIRSHLLLALAEARSERRLAATVLSNHIAHPDFSARIAALAALRDLDGPPEIAIPAFMEAIQDENRAVKRYGLEGLGKLGPAASRAADLVATLTNNPSAMVRKAAIAALQSIHTKP